MDINYILKDFNVDFEAKKITVISGESGSGKSTIINLIEKIYDVDEGQILIDDKYVLNDILSKEVKNKKHNIPFSLEDYRNIIGYVPQEPILCNDTIRTNILYGRNGISDEKIWEVLKQVNLYDFVKRLDNKLDYLVGNKGSKLSGGQKQRICIARALVNDPKILILDEATSSLDKINENQILELLESLRDKVSIIFITHKPDILTIADQIFIIADDFLKKADEDIANIGYYFLDAEHERRFLRCINKELMGIITREEALRLKKRTLNSLKEKRLVILSGSVKQLETKGEKQT